MVEVMVRFVLICSSQHLLSIVTAQEGKDASSLGYPGYYFQLKIHYEVQIGASVRGLFQSLYTVVIHCDLFGFHL